jgi:glycine/D-amino acid oxidase-like deaminating enzyme
MEYLKMYRDILVIGAGVLGLSSALHLKKLNMDRTVLVIDKLGAPGQGNTAKSAGIFLNLFTTEVNYLLSDSTTNWFHHLQENLGHRLNLTQCGYLYLLDESRYSNLEKPISEMRKRGIQLEIYDRESLQRLIPDLVLMPADGEKAFMGLDPIDAGVLGVKCGSVNTDFLARALETEFLKLGGEVSYNTTAGRLIVKPKKELGVLGEPFVWQDLTVVGAETNRGLIRAETTVVAAGVWSERLLDPIGFDTLMRPKKRSIFVFDDLRLGRLRDTKGFSKHNLLPFTNIPELMVYLKADPVEGNIWLGCADDFGRGYGLEDDPSPERGLYSNNIYHALVEYLPCFRNVRPLNSWAGQRAINRYDGAPVVAPGPGLIYVGSASGYGITKCDGLGRTVAVVYSGEEEVELYSGHNIEASSLGVEKRNVGREAFKV